MSDTINRVPPPIPPRDPLRSVGPATTPVVRREDQQPEKNKKHPQHENHDEPQDTVELSVPPDELHDDGMDQFWITLSAATDLLNQHQHVYSPVDFQQLLGHLIHLKNSDTKKIYWPPTMTFADAVAHAAQDGLLPPETI